MEENCYCWAPNQTALAMPDLPRMLFSIILMTTAKFWPEKIKVTHPHGGAGSVYVTPYKLLHFESALRN